jgi:hypothetical protein
MVGIVLSREWKDVDEEKIYKAGWEGIKEAIFGRVEEVKFQFLSEVVEFIWILDSNQLGMDALWNSFFL